MSWQFDEAAHAGPEHFNAAYVAGFDIKAQTDWSEEIATLLAVGAGTTSTIVDLGAGTGTFAQAIAGRVARVVSVDISPAMVAMMQARGLEAVRAGFLSYEHTGESPDAIFSNNALQASHGDLLRLDRRSAAFVWRTPQPNLAARPASAIGASVATARRGNNVARLGAASWSFAPPGGARDDAGGLRGPPRRAQS